MARLAVGHAERFAVPERHALAQRNPVRFAVADRQLDAFGVAERLRDAVRFAVGQRFADAGFQRDADLGPPTPCVAAGGPARVRYDP